MPPLPLNQDGSINYAQLNSESNWDTYPAAPSMSNNVDTSDLDKQIKLYKDAMKEASGYKLKELQQQLDIAQADREERIQAANISADASKYGADQGLAGTKYASDNSLTGTKYSSDNSLKGTQYGADSSAASSRYGTDADLYKFNATQPNEQAKTALSFLTQYEDLASHPDSFLQASNYARLGQQVNGMPAMMQDLLNVSSNGSGVGSNGAFRSAVPGAAMPQTAAQAIFGDNPLGLGTQPQLPAPPTWTGPQGSVPYQPPAGTNYSAYGAPNGNAVNMTYSTVGAPNEVSSYGAPTASTNAMPTWYGPQGSAASPGMMSGAFSNLYAPVGAATAGQPAAHRGAIVGSYGAQAGLPPPAPPTTGTMPSLGGPRVLNGGQIANPDTSSEDALKSGAQTLMQRGAQQWGNQALEKMNTTDRGLLDSAIKANGGNPQDYYDAYARSRISNDGAGRAL